MGRFGDTHVSPFENLRTIGAQKLYLLMALLQYSGRTLKCCLSAAWNVKPVNALISTGGSSG